VTQGFPVSDVLPRKIVNTAALYRITHYRFNSNYTSVPRKYQRYCRLLFLLGYSISPYHSNFLIPNPGFLSECLRITKLLCFLSFFFLCQHTLFQLHPPVCLAVGTFGMLTPFSINYRNCPPPPLVPVRLFFTEHSPLLPISFPVAPVTFYLLKGLNPPFFFPHLNFPVPFSLIFPCGPQKCLLSKGLATPEGNSGVCIFPF